MEKTVFVINGSGGTGKDTFVKLFSKLIPSLNFSSMDPVLPIARACGWDGTKTEENRKFLSDLKKLLVAYNDLPFRYMENRYRQFFDDETHSYMFLHIREPEEIQRAVDKFGAKTILVSNENVGIITSNDSDSNVNNYNYDYIIQNNHDLAAYKHTVQEFIDAL